jgi:hypothetical protein
MKRKLSREMTIILQTWPMQNRLPSSGCGQSRPGPGRPPAKITLMPRAIVPAAAYQIEANESQVPARFDADVFPSRGRRRGRVAMLQSARDQVNQTRSERLSDEDGSDGKARA